MKKVLSLMIAVLLAVGCLSACSSGDSQSDADNGIIQIVTTIFPEYDWVMNILGDNPAKADVTMLLDTGVDLHSFQPTAEDILKISTCDLFIYVGGESDEWVYLLYAQRRKAALTNSLSQNQKNFKFGKQNCFAAFDVNCKTCDHTRISKMDERLSANSMDQEPKPSPGAPAPLDLLQHNYANRINDLR